MFVKTSLKWSKPEDRTLVLTYDDGPRQINAEPGVPGPRTLELAKYLHEMNIRATFFVIGKHAEEHGKVLAELARLGHLIGNHTYNHPSGDPHDVSGWTGDRVDHFAEIQRTHEIIKPYVRGKFFFRSPGGSPWPAKKPHLVDTLNQDTNLRQYVGPVVWNIESQDWTCWRDGDCAKKAVAHIQGQIVTQGGSGIILMHDCSTEQPEQEAKLRRNNRALEVAQILLPQLIAAGYQFKRLDEVPLTPQ